MTENSNPKRREVFINFIPLGNTLNMPNNTHIENVFPDMKNEYEYLYRKGVITENTQYIYNSPDTIVYNCPINKDNPRQITAQIERLFEYCRNNPNFSINVLYSSEYSPIILALVFALNEEPQSTQDQIVIG